MGLGAAIAGHLTPGLRGQVIEPIQSRCAIVRYSRLADQEILQRLLHVARTEQVVALQQQLESSCDA